MKTNKIINFIEAVQAIESDSPYWDISCEIMARIALAERKAAANE